MILSLLIVMNILSCNRIDNLDLKRKGPEMSQEQIKAQIAKNTLLFKAIESNDISKVEKAFYNGADVNYITNDGLTPLSLAYSSEKNEIVNTLKKMGANINTPDKFERIALLMACNTGNIELAKMLINELGANINIKNKKSQDNPLLHACANGHSDVAKFLLDNGADVNAANKNGMTPLIYACSINNLGLATLLLDNGADVNAADKEKNTPLLYACSINNLGLATLLLDNGADVNLVNKEKNTPLLYACYNNNLDLATLLLTKGRADVDSVNKNGMTPLIYACYNNNLDLATLLLDNGADVNAINKKDITPLTQAYIKGSWEVFKYLINLDIENKINISMVDKNRSLLSACRDNEKEIVELLIKAKADIDVKDEENNETPFTLAEKNNNYEIVDILNKKYKEKEEEAAKILQSMQKKNTTTTGEPKTKKAKEQEE